MPQIQRDNGIVFDSVLLSANNISSSSTTTPPKKHTQKKKTLVFAKTILYSTYVFCWDWSLGTILAHRSGLSSGCLILRVCGALFRPMPSVLSKIYMCLLFQRYQRRMKNHISPTKDAFLHVLHARLEPNYFNLTQQFKSVGLVAPQTETN